MDFRPCIDLHDGKVKQIVGSTLGGAVKTNFSATNDAKYFGGIFDEYSLSGGHICILDREDSTFNQAFDVLSKYPNAWQVGGGINEKSAGKYLDAGADKVIVSSALFDLNPSKSPFDLGELHDSAREDPLGDKGDLKEGDYKYLVFRRAEALAQKIGRENLVLDLSCQSFEEKAPPLVPPQRGGLDSKYFVMKDGWRTKTGLEVNVETLERLSEFCAEFLIHGVSVEGKNAGFDEDLVAILTEFKKGHKIAITYAGGLHSIEDCLYFKKVSKGLLDFTIGSSLDVYGGKLNLKDILKV